MRCGGGLSADVSEPDDEVVVHDVVAGLDLHSAVAAGCLTKMRIDQRPTDV
jgi:hypothetical protein